MLLTGLYFIGYIYFRNDTESRLTTFNLYDGHVMINDLHQWGQLKYIVFLPAIVIESRCTNVPFHLASKENKDEIRMIVGWQ